MTRGVKLALLGASLFALGACAASDRQADLDNIAANVEQTQEGDFGEFLNNLNEAGDKARRAEEIHDDLAEVPPYLHVEPTLLERAPSRRNRRQSIAAARKTRSTASSIPCAPASPISNPCTCPRRSGP